MSRTSTSYAGRPACQRNVTCAMSPPRVSRSSSYHETSCFSQGERMDQRLLAVAIELLDEEGWSALTLDRVAERAGLSRATVWRHGVTQASVEAVLRAQLVRDYRDALWGPL